jgi:hypothetical protein
MTERGRPRGERERAVDGDCGPSPCLSVAGATLPRRGDTATSGPGVTGRCSLRRLTSANDDRALTRQSEPRTTARGPDTPANSNLKGASARILSGLSSKRFQDAGVVPERPSWRSLQICDAAGQNSNRVLAPFRMLSSELTVSAACSTSTGSPPDLSLASPVGWDLPGDSPNLPRQGTSVGMLDAVVNPPGKHPSGQLGTGHPRCHDSGQQFALVNW